MNAPHQRLETPDHPLPSSAAVLRGGQRTAVSRPRDCNLLRSRATAEDGRGIRMLVFVALIALVAGCGRMSDSGIPRALNTDALLRTAGQGQNITFGAVGSGESRSGFAVQSEREFAITISSGTSGHLLAAYRSKVKRQIEGMGAKIHDTGLSGSETNVDAFSYGYSWSGNEGIVRVHSFPRTNSQVVILLFCYEHRR